MQFILNEASYFASKLVFEHSSLPKTGCLSFHYDDVTDRFHHETGNESNLVPTVAAGGPAPGQGGNFQHPDVQAVVASVLGAWRPVQTVPSSLLQKDQN